MPYRHVKWALAVASAVVACLLVLALASPPAAAHACYVLVNATQPECPRAGPDGEMLARGLTASWLVPVLLVGLFAAPVALPAARRLVDARAPGAAARAADAAREYAREFVPLVLRVGLGVSLVAEGLSGAFLSPLLPHRLGPVIALAGGMLIVGAATRWAAYAAVGFFLGALPGSTHLLGNLESLVVAGLFAWRLPAGRPSVDDWLRRARGCESAAEESVVVPLALRAGLGAALAYGALSEKLLDPGVMAQVAEARGLAGFLGLPAESWVVLVGVGELAFALALVAGLEVRAAALGLVGVSLAMTTLLAENVATHAALLAAALALALAGAGGFRLRLAAEFDRGDLSAWRRSNASSKLDIPPPAESSSR